MKALAFIYPVFFEKSELILGLDTFSYNLDTETVSLIMPALLAMVHPITKERYLSILPKTKM